MNDRSRELSYSAGDRVQRGPRRLLIRFLERITGVRQISELYSRRKVYLDRGVDYPTTGLALLNVRVHARGAPVESIPSSGPLVVVANHPFGFIDGLIASHLVGRVRSDFRILLNAALRNVPEIEEKSLYIADSREKRARELNVSSRQTAVQMVRDGHVIIVFPAGSVSSAPRPWTQVVDDEWGVFTARMILQGQASVVPLYFEGQNSWLFQLAGLVSPAARMALLVHEVRRRIGTEFNVTIGRTIPFGELQAFSTRTSMMEFLRERTYSLAKTRPGQDRGTLVFEPSMVDAPGTSGRDERD